MILVDHLVTMRATSNFKTFILDAGSVPGAIKMAAEGEKQERTTEVQQERESKLGGIEQLKQKIDGPVAKSVFDEFKSKIVWRKSTKDY